MLPTLWVRLYVIVPFLKLVIRVSGDSGLHYTNFKFTKMGEKSLKFTKRILWYINKFQGKEWWHARRDLNPRPLDSKSTALSTELRAHQLSFKKRF